MSILVVSDGSLTARSESGHGSAQLIELMPHSETVFSIIIGDSFRKNELEESHSDYIFFTRSPDVHRACSVSAKFCSPPQSRIRKRELGSIAGRVQLVIDEIKPNLVLFTFQCRNLAKIARGLNTHYADRFVFFGDSPSWTAKFHNEISGKPGSYLDQDLKELCLTAKRVFVSSEQAKTLLNISLGDTVPVQILSEVQLLEGNRASLHVKDAEHVSKGETRRVSSAIWSGNGPVLDHPSNSVRVPESIFVWHRWSFRRNIWFLFSALNAAPRVTKKHVTEGNVFSRMRLFAGSIVETIRLSIFGRLELSAERAQARNREKLGVNAFVPGTLSARDQAAVLSNTNQHHHKLVEKIGREWCKR